MKILSRILFPALLLGAPMALAQDAAPQAGVSAPAASTIDISFRGSLRDALKTIADKGGLNLVVTGDLDSPAEVHLRGVTANQALRTVARAYSLRLEQDGTIFTLRPMTEKEKHAAALGESEPSVNDTPAPVANAPSTVTVPPLPPIPPMPPMPEHFSEDVREEMKHARDEMKRARDEVRRNMRRTSSRNGSRNVVARGQNLEVKEGQTV